MERYRTPAPRSTLAIAAALASAATFALAVMPIGASHVTARPAASPPVEVAIVPARIEVIAVRSQAAARNDSVPVTGAGERRG